MKTRLEEHYFKNVQTIMIEKFNYLNKFQVPKLQKVVVNMGVGDAVKDSKRIDGAVKDMSVITGQKPVVTRAKKAIATFKLREGMPIGVKVTLRRAHMYEFIDRLINIALPRVRDFRGLSSKSFDGFGNYNLGIKEQIIFPEIEYDNVDVIRGMDICVVTTANTDEEGKELLHNFQFPFVGN